MVIRTSGWTRIIDKNNEHLRVDFLPRPSLENSVEKQLKTQLKNERVADVFGPTNGREKRRDQNPSLRSSRWLKYDVFIRRVTRVNAVK